MNAADALSLLRAQAAENANGATANLATLNNGAASLFAKYRAGSLALRPIRTFAISQFLYIYDIIICQFLYDFRRFYLSIFVIWGFNATP